MDQKLKVYISWINKSRPVKKTHNIKRNSKLFLPFSCLIYITINQIILVKLLCSKQQPFFVLFYISFCKNLTIKFWNQKSISFSYFSIISKVWWLDQKNHYKILYIIVSLANYTKNCVFEIFFNIKYNSTYRNEWLFGLLLLKFNLILNLF